MTEISIIVPVYNVEAYLSRCVNSILTQTYDDFELILVDDGSTDNSGKICDNFVSSDPRIRVIHKENGGVSSARNAGLDICVGKYVSFVDSDDFIAPIMLENLHSLAEKEKADIVDCGFTRVFDSTQPQDITSTDEYTITDGRTAIRNLPGAASSWAKLYRRELFRNLRFEEGRIYEDTLLLPFLYYEAEKVVTTPASYYCYFQRPGSIMQSNYSIKNLDILYVYEMRLDFFAEKGLTEAYNLLNADYPFILVKTLRKLKEHSHLDPDKSIRCRIYAEFRNRFSDFIKNPKLIWKQKTLLAFYLLFLYFVFGGKRKYNPPTDGKFQ